MERKVKTGTGNISLTGTERFYAGNGDVLLTRSEAANLLRCGVSTLDKNKRIPFVKNGRSKRYIREEILDFIKTIRRGAYDN